MPHRAIAWMLAGLVALALPFIVLLAGERHEGRNMTWDFAMGLGFGALALGGLQFALTARFRPLTRPFGADIVYLFHRYLAIGAVLVMLGHFGILYIWFEPDLGELNPFEARWELTAGRVALVAFGLLVVTSEFRKWLKLDYELWRYLHFGLAVIGFCAAIAHVLGVGRFTAAIETRALWLGVTLAWLLLLVWLRVGKPWLQRRNPWRVVSNEPQHGGAHSITLEPLGRPLKPWQSGQFVWLTLESSPFAFDEHPFTIASAPESAPRVTVSIKPLGDFSSRAAAAQPGDIGYLEGPFGAFSIERAAPDAAGFVMVAGGIGITPMLANLRAMAEHGDPRPVWLFYANPDLDSAAFREELAELETPLQLTLVHVLEQPPAGSAAEKGFVTREILEKHLPPDLAGLRFLLCGPEPMTEAVSEALEGMGVAPARIKTELFDLV
jgi:predicted ferric reductase